MPPDSSPGAEFLSNRYFCLCIISRTTRYGVPRSVISGPVQTFLYRTKHFWICNVSRASPSASPPGLRGGFLLPAEGDDRGFPIPRWPGGPITYPGRNSCTSHLPSVAGRGSLLPPLLSRLDWVHPIDLLLFPTGSTWALSLLAGCQDIGRTRGGAARADCWSRPALSINSGLDRPRR